MSDVAIAAPARGRGAGVRAGVAGRWVEWMMLAGIAGALVWERWVVCQAYLFRYTDEDQTAMWYAAHDLLRGRIAEPAFYGQDYNSCLEGYLAAPLVAMRVPYNVACPLVTVVLGLLPFVILAVVAARRGWFVAAAGALLVPVVLPDRYAMICGIPRGFVNGIGVAAVAMWLLLPEARETGVKRRRGWMAGAKYCAAGAVSVAALQVNPSCVILLAAVWTFTGVTQFWNWRMWVFAAVGAAVAAPYPWYVYQFYHVWHPDYVLYLRGDHFAWGMRYFWAYVRFAFPAGEESPAFADVLPVGVSAAHAEGFLIGVAAVLAGLLAVRLRVAGLAALLVGMGMVVVSFAYERVGRGEASNTISYAYSRMWLAVPVLVAWGVFLLGGRKKGAWSRGWVWAGRGGLAVMVVVAMGAAVYNVRQVPVVVEAELDADGYVVCPAVPVADLMATAREVKRAAAEQHADLVVIFGGDRQKHFDYALPALAGVETLFPTFERRTFRLAEEWKGRHQKVLEMFDSQVRGKVAGGRVVHLTEEGEEVAGRGVPGTHAFILPAITVMDAGGKSIYEVRELRYRLPGVREGSGGKVLVQR